MQDKKELKDEELQKTSGGMKIIIPELIEKYKKYLIDLINKTKKNKDN